MAGPDDPSARHRPVAVRRPEPREPDGFGRLLPELVGPIPGPASRAELDRLRAVESRNVTWDDPDEPPRWPVAWSRAKGANVLDADGNRYLDLTAAFGVSLAGHRPDSVVRALRRQTDRLIHGMGDVHPPTAKVRLLEALSEVLTGGPFGPEIRATLANSGSEAVEIALKTAELATGRSGVVAFEGGYHGLTLGSLATTHRADFRKPFGRRTWSGVAWAPYPGVEHRTDGTDGSGEEPTPPPSDDAILDRVRGWLRDGVPGPDGPVPVGAVVVEAVQARGGVRVMPREFAVALSDLAHEHEVVLIADEIFSGLGRCGAVLASERVGLCPDLVALGKVLGGGLPLSACVGSPRVMDAWPASEGEALHTSTFLGHPLACAAGAAMLRDEVARGLPERAERTGGRLRAAVDRVLEGRPGVTGVRGLGLLLGFECLDPEGGPEGGAAVEVATRLLARGVMVLPAGEVGSVVELTPPVGLTDAQIEFAAEAVGEVLDGMGRRVRG